MWKETQQTLKVYHSRRHAVRKLMRAPKSTMKMTTTTDWEFRLVISQMTERSQSPPRPAPPPGPSLTRQRAGGSWWQRKPQADGGIVARRRKESGFGGRLWVGERKTLRDGEGEKKTDRQGGGGRPPTKTAAKRAALRSLQSFESDAPGTKRSPRSR